MTAEIAVYNKSAIALAADSAVTITNSDGQSKIYNGAEKLFSLSTKHPVGIMLYGAGSLCRVPWEVIIKEYRKELDDTGYDTLDEYAESFFSFLSKDRIIIPNEMKQQSTKSFLSSIFHSHIVNPNILTDFADSFKKENATDPTSVDLYNSLLVHTSNISNILNSNDFYQGFDDDDITASLKECHAYAQVLIEEYLNDTFHTPELYESIGEAFSKLLCKSSPVIPYTGVVFAGFGEKEFFPTILTYQVPGFHNDKIKYSPIMEKSSAGGISGYTAFAQEDQIDTFMSGISTNIGDCILDQHRKVVFNLLEEIQSLLYGSELPDNQVETIIKSLEKKAEICDSEALSNVQRFIQEQHKDKILDMIEFLPKKELAEMAETLISLTAFKRKVSTQEESVGGPIDVALISKGDGFIWIQRKHYFDKDLNLRFVNQLSVK